jgi:phage terminase large subunit-like protein
MSELWPTHGPLACRWIEANLIHAEGDFFGQPFRLRSDQRLFIYRWYEYHPGTESAHEPPVWRYKRALKGEAKGGGKTELCAAIACLEFAGPPQIAPKSPNIPVAAASFEQADLLFGAAGTMLGGKDGVVTQAPLRAFFEVYDTEILFADGRPGRLFRVAAAAGTNDGGKPTLFVADELHEWGMPGSNKARVHTVISNGLRKRRGGRELNLSTAGFDLDSHLGKMYQHGKRIEHDPSIDPEFLFDWREAPEGLDYDDPEQRAVAVRAASAAAGTLWSVEERVRRYDDPVVARHEWIRYFANRWINVAEDSWLADHPGAWKACEQPGARIPAGAEVVMAVDMALRHDSTAVAIIHARDDGRFVVRSTVWRPAGGKIDHLDVMAHIRDQAARYTVRSIAYDPRFFEVPAQMLTDEGLPMVEIPQSPERMVPACGFAYELIVNQKVIHDGDPVLADHVNSAARRETDRGWTLSKGRSRRHIDACIAMVMALWELHHEEPEPEVAEFISF